MTVSKTRIPTDKDLIATLGSKVAVTAVTDTYTFVATDAGNLVNVNKGTAVTVTVPADTFAAGQQIEVLQGGAGAVTVAAGAGMTQRVDATNTAVTNGQWSKAVITFISATEYVINGELVPA